MFGKTAVGRRRKIKVPLPKALLAAARELGIDVSQAVEAGVADAVSDKRLERWVSQNPERMASMDEYLERTSRLRREDERAESTEAGATAQMHETNKIQTGADETSIPPVKPSCGVTLTHDVMTLIEAQMRSGRYASESELIREGVKALLARERAVETWFQDQVGRAYSALKAEPGFAITIQAMCKHLAAEIESAFREQ